MCLIFFIIFLSPGERDLWSLSLEMSLQVRLTMDIFVANSHVGFSWFVSRYSTRGSVVLMCLFQISLCIVTPLCCQWREVDRFISGWLSTQQRWKQYKHEPSHLRLTKTKCRELHRCIYFFVGRIYCCVANPSVKFKKLFVWIDYISWIHDIVIGEYVAAYLLENKCFWELSLPPSGVKIWQNSSGDSCRSHVTSMIARTTRGHWIQHIPSPLRLMPWTHTQRDAERHNTFAC